MGNLRKPLLLIFGFLTANSSLAFPSGRAEEGKSGEPLTTLTPLRIPQRSTQPLYSLNGPQSNRYFLPSPLRFPSIEEDEEDDELGSDLETQDCEDYMEYGQEHNRD